MNIDDRVDSLYKLAKKYPDNQELQEAVSVIKSLRGSQGQYKRWNQQYRDDNNNLKDQVLEISTNNLDLQKELESLNAEMLNLTQEKTKIIAQREQAIAELKHIEMEVKVAAHNVRSTKSVYGKLTILWTLVKSLFLDDNWEDFGSIDNSLPPDPDKPQMGSGQSNINKSLLDK
jgi:predicted RNase H-like nuclease (RuvC/YqgF family)